MIEVISAFAGGLVVGIAVGYYFNEHLWSQAIHLLGEHLPAAHQRAVMAALEAAKASQKS